MSYMQTIDHLVETVRKACDRGCNCSLLIGAGCSVTAGIPTAGGFVNRIEKEYPKKFALADKKTYAECMAELTPGERRSLIAEYVDAARINWAHVAIACLLRNGFVDRVLTTNFDPLVVRACALLNEFPAVYDFATSSLYKGAFVPDKAVFHLHGQRTGFVLINTQEDYDRHSGLLAPVFEDAGRGRVWVVVGYSGESDPVFDHLAETRSFDEGLYWIGYKDGDAPAHVREKLLTPDKSAYYVQGFDADGFFVTLGRKLNVFPPDLLDKPFTHLDACLQTLTPEFTEPGQDTPTDVCRHTRGLVGRAIQRFEEEVVEETDEAKREIAEARSMSELQRLLMAGDYDAVINEYAKATEDASDAVRDAAAWAYLARGAELVGQAKRVESQEADPLYARAAEQYEAAIKTYPDFTVAFNNWATLLLTHGAMPHMSERSRATFSLAKEKAMEAERMEPGEGAYNVACACARLGEEAECRRWLETALEHGTLPMPAHMEKDPDLDSVREADWFKEILEKAPRLVVTRGVLERLRKAKKEGQG